MLKSMTGFGRGEGDTSLGRLVVESRSVNHRFCDISIKLPKRLASFETRIKEMIRSEVSRGKIDVTLRLDQTSNGKIQFDVDFHLAEQYYKALKSLSERLNLKGEVTLELLAGAKDLITVKEETFDAEPYWQEVEPILRASLKDMDQMKRVEGESLFKDLEQRVDRIISELDAIKKQFPSSLNQYLNRLRERLRSLLNGMEVDSIRFQQELAFWAERTDITEEITRAESHISQLANLLKTDEPVGRKIEFLIQEIHREVNTISAKANDVEISKRVVEIKGELEKVREQVQNIE